MQTEVCELYRIASSRQCSWYEFAGKIFELMGFEPDFAPTCLPDRQATTAAFGAKARRTCAPETEPL